MTIIPDDYPAQPPVSIDAGGMLWVSGVIHDWSLLNAHGITVVIDLEADVDHGVPSRADHILYIYLPIHDGELPNLDRLHAVATLASSLITAGHRVLAHCGMGLNRSALAAGLVLVRMGMQPATAVDLIRERRPGALYNEHFVRHLLEQVAGSPTETCRRDAG
ncbi:MAG: dual specificity protein phosphatase family protein [Planctomycetia bacterium]